jgi:hypothetical protein
VTAVTKEMIGAAHDVMLEKGDLILSARLLERIYVAMNEAAPAGEPVAWLYDFPNPNNPREDMVRDWVSQSMEVIERDHGFNVRPLYLKGQP